MATSYSSAPLGSKQRSSDLISTAKKMLTQTKAEGTKAFKGSKYDTPNEPIEADKLANVTPLELPEQPRQKDIGNIVQGNMAGLVNPSMGLSLGSDGNLMYQPPSNESDPFINLQKQFLSMQEAPPDTADIYRREERRLGLDDKRQEVQNYTSQLNSIVAKAKADQLSLEGQGRGIPEVIIGGQQAQINKEAAIAALPVQAQLAAAQGNLQMAQQTLDTVFKLKVQDATAKYEYKNKLIDSVMSFATKAEERKLEEKKLQNDRAYKQEQDNLSLINDWSKMAVQNGQSNLVTAFSKLDPKSPSFIKDFAKVQSQIVDRSSALDNEYKQAQIDKIRSDISGAGGSVYSSVDVNALPSTAPANVKNTEALTAIIANNKRIAEGTRTALRNVLGVVASAEDMAMNNAGGNFIGLSPFRNVTDFSVGIPFSDKEISLPFRQAGKRNATIDNETYISGINLKTQQWASGASLTEQQTKQVEAMVPKVTDTDRQVKTKLNQLTNFMMSQAKVALQAEGVDFIPAKVDLFETVNLLDQASPEQMKLLEEEGLI